MNNTTCPKLKLLTLSAVIALSLTTVTGCEDATASVDSAPKKEEIIKVPVEAAPVIKSNIANYYASNAILETTREADVISKVQGLVEEVLVEEGDYVEKGQVLAKLDDDRYQLLLQQRQAELAQVKSELDRINAAQSKSLVSADQLEKLQWQYESLQAATNLAKLDVKETHILAPIDGFISARYVKTGNLVHQYQHKNLFHIVSQKKLEGVIYLPEGRFPEVSVNQPVKLTLPAASNKTYEAFISRISPVVDSSNGTFKVVVEVDNTSKAIKPGMFAEVNIQLGLHTDTLLAPASAVISMDNQSFVYKVLDGKAVKTPVEIGYRHNGLVELVSGVSEAESLITAGHNNLKNDAEVNVIDVEL